MTTTKGICDQIFTREEFEAAKELGVKGFVELLSKEPEVLTKEEEANLLKSMRK